MSCRGGGRIPKVLVFTNHYPLPFTKDPRLFINLLFTRQKKSGDLDDGYGAWRWDKQRCTVITREQVSSAGRVFNPGNDLLVLEFDAANHVMTVLDGSYLADFKKVE